MAYMTLASLGFDWSEATNNALSALEASPTELAQLLERFLPLCGDARSRMLSRTADQLPPTLPARVNSQDDLADYVALGRPGDTWNARLQNAWTQIAADIDTLAPAPQSPSDGAACRDELPPLSYDFSVFAPYSVNLGLRLLYRQEWRMLGNQPGDIVRTIPLGPKQTEKVSTKILRRTKVTRTAESLKATETTTETADTTKDSTEIVRETAENSSWKEEAEGGFAIGEIFKLGGGMSSSGQSEERSNYTKSHLSEAMRKTAGRMRTETKVVVSTESESTYELSTASEIQNPNDEVAVTYVYSKLQRQYEVFTALAEVANVVMVAEPLPAPAEVSVDWIRQHDWIISQVLLDDSFRDVLSTLSQEIEGSDPSALIEELATTNKTALEHLGSLAQKTGTLSLSTVDVAQEAQRGYREAKQNDLERLRLKNLMDLRRKRLCRHIRENILHYCRAIWSREDPDRRLLRYRRMGVLVPMDFHFDGVVGSDEGQLDLRELLDRLTLADQTGIPLHMNGRFVPVDDGYCPLADVIDPTGPIGFHGNYAVYRMRPEYVSRPMTDVLDLLKVPYLYEGPPVCGDGAASGEAGPLLDPELKALRAKYLKGPTEPDRAARETAIADRATREDIAQRIPHLRVGLAVAEAQDERQRALGLPSPHVEAFFADLEQFRNSYADYVFRLAHSRRFPVDTNALVVDLIRGKGSAFEPFKLAHRGIDVLRAAEETTKLALENNRRAALLGKNNLGDPDIEKVTVVTTHKDAGPVNISIVEDE